MKSEYTKQILTDSLKKLMRQKPLDKISIREITENAGMNRQTFYYHFSDIYNQLQWMFEQEVMDLFSQYKGEEVWREGLLHVFNYFRNNKEICFCALKSVGREYLFQYFHGRVHDIVASTVENLCGEREQELDQDYKEMLIEYYTVSFGSVVEHWVYGMINKSPEELVEFFDMMLQDHIRGIALRINEE